MLITISRQTGSRGEEIAELLAQKLDLPIISRDLAISQWFPEIASPHQLMMLAESPGFYLTPTAEGITFAAFLENKLRQYAAAQPAIIYGMGAQIIFAGHPEALHVKIMASPEKRISRIMQAHNLARKDAERFLAISDRKHKRYISTIYEQDWSDPALYHLTLNTDFLGVAEAASLLEYTARHRQQSAAVETGSETGSGTRLPVSADKNPVVFKHPSEAEFAKILDMYDLNWQYEPRTFPIKWDAEGNITQAFSPDFYLPRFDTYIELTTMNQKYTSEKKHKVALLKSLYPGTNINIVFKNDFHTLIKRFGLRGGSDSK